MSSCTYFLQELILRYSQQRNSYSNDPSHSSDNATFLTHWAAEECLWISFMCLSLEWGELFLSETPTLFLKFDDCLIMFDFFPQLFWFLPEGKIPFLGWILQNSLFSLVFISLSFFSVLGNHVSNFSLPSYFQIFVMLC